MVLKEAFGELSTVTQQIVKNPFDCTDGCDFTILYAIFIGAVVTIIVLSIQIQLAREQQKIKKIVTKTKLKNDAITLLNQMRIMQPIVFEKRPITPENRMQITSIARSIKEFEDSLNLIDQAISNEEKQKILQIIERIKKRLKYGSTDFGKWPHRYEAMDFSESIRDVGITLSALP
ncbi:MAG TPA: hypothetical protein VLA01_04050 [Nitrosopumilaceae archaeon]|nr:hypothetical protein [Nitrosopumilaceae archaeon]